MDQDINREDSLPLMGERKRVYSIDEELPRAKGSILGGYIIFLLLGLAPQILQNALFSETPFFLQDLPEGKSISAYIVTCFMFANLVCFLYLLLQQCIVIPDTVLVHVILIGNIISAILVMLFWDKTVELPLLGKTSYVVLICSLIGGLLGNISTLVFFSFASRYLPIFTAALSAGFGLSGVVTSGLAIAQNPQSRYFEIPVFFMVVIPIAIVAFFALMLLLHTHFGEHLRVPRPLQDSSAEYGSIRSFRSLFFNAGWLLFTMFWVSALTFFIPGAIPFMGRGLNEMSYLNAIFLVVPPIGAALAGLYKFYRTGITAVFQSAAFFYIILPLLKAGHKTFPTFAWLLYILMVMVGLLSGYTTTMIYMRIRQEFGANAISVERISRWAAFANQMGAVVGILINDVMIKRGLYFY